MGSPTNFRAWSKSQLPRVSVSNFFKKGVGVVPQEGRSMGLG